jgi:hypothetical protein
MFLGKNKNLYFGYFLWELLIFWIVCSNKACLFYLIFKITA